MPHDTIQRDVEVWDVGGGKFPFVDAKTKEILCIHSVGLDISAEELAAAAPGTYDETFVADITHFAGRGTADLIICQAVLEHVHDTAAALRALETILKPGGLALLFVPARNSWFARLNSAPSGKVEDSSCWQRSTVSVRADKDSHLITTAAPPRIFGECLVGVD